MGPRLVSRGVSLAFERAYKADLLLQWGRGS